MDKSNKHSKDPQKKNNMLKTCEICGGIGYQPVSICCRCKITREHPYCMKIFHAVNPKDWVCEECELGDQRRASSSKPVVSSLGDHARACSSKCGISELRDQTRDCSSEPGPSKEPNNTTTRGKIIEPPRRKVEYLPPEVAKTLSRTSPTKAESIKCRTVNRTSPLKSQAIRCSTMNRAPPNFCVYPNTPGKPISTVNRTSPPKPEAIKCRTVNRASPLKSEPIRCSTMNRRPPAVKLQSPSSLPNTQQDKKLSSFKDTEKHVAKKHHARQDSNLAIRSAKEAQTSNATAEERRAAQPFRRNPSASKPSPGKNIKPNSERDNNNPGRISRQLAQDLRPARSDKGPSRQLCRENFAGMPVPREKVEYNTERVIKNAGHDSMQPVRHSIATSSGAAQPLRRNPSASKPSPGKNIKEEGGTWEPR